MTTICIQIGTVNGKPSPSNQGALTTDLGIWNQYLVSCCQPRNLIDRVELGGSNRSIYHILLCIIVLWLYYKFSVYSHLLSTHDLKGCFNVVSYTCPNANYVIHYNDAIMGAIASQITSLTIIYSIVYSDTNQRKHRSSASLTFVRGNHRGSVNSPHKWPVTRKMFPFPDVIMPGIFLHYNHIESPLVRPPRRVFFLLSAQSPIYVVTSNMVTSPLRRCMQY